MFSKLKSSAGSPTSSNSLLELNPIAQYFEFGKQIGSAGPELVWKIYDAIRKPDRKVNIVVRVQFFYKFIYTNLH